MPEICHTATRGEGLGETISSMDWSNFVAEEWIIYIPEKLNYEKQHEKRAVRSSLNGDPLILPVVPAAATATYWTESERIIDYFVYVLLTSSVLEVILLCL